MTGRNTTGSLRTKLFLLVSLAVLTVAAGISFGYFWGCTPLHNLPLKAFLTQQGTLIAAVLAVMYFIVYITLRIFVVPIEKLHRAVEEISRGNWEQRIDVRTDDEIGELSDSVTRLIMRINADKDKLQAQAKELNESQDAALNMLEDISTANEELERDYNTQAVLNSCLRISLENIPLKEALQRILNQITGISLAMLEQKGSIYLIEGDPNVLVMQAQHGLPEELQKMCVRIPVGTCICGRVALSGEVMRIDSVDERHDIRYEGMPEHGHYCVPVKSAGKVSGLLELYLKEGCRGDEKEERFLQAVANIISGVIERKRLEQLKDEFLSNVSHELRSPLSIIKEGISLVLDRVPGEINNKQEKFLSDVSENVDRLARIVSDLLDISKIESGKIELRISRVNIAILAKDTALSFKSKMDKKGLELVLNIPEEEVYADADKDKISQIFVNLIDNAIKFTEKGRIEVYVGKNSEVECYVEDTGIGISEENLGRVFGKFQQFSRFYGPGVQGTGLGLSIGKALVEMHNGRIKVESQVDKGTRFTFTIPKYYAKTVSARGGGMGKKILLVDDDLSFLEIMGERIESWGYEVIKVSSAKEGINSVRNRAGDIVILDYVMPDMDGVAALEEMRRIDRKIPVIMFTAYPDQKSIKGTEKLYVSAYIPKLSEYADMHMALKATLDMVSKELEKKAA